MDCFTSLLCTEDYRLIVEDDEVDKEVNSGLQRKLQKLFLDDSDADYEIVSNLLEKEAEMIPRDDYLVRLQSGGLDVSARNDSVDWIYKVYRHYSFEPLTACLAVNYLDRFLSEYEIPRGSSNCKEPWRYHLLSVSCLSVAAKMEEISVPMSLDLQVIEGNLIFEPKTIQRMELLLLSVLKWRTNAVTPLSFIDYFLQRFTNPDDPDPKSVVSRSVELILTTAKGVEFLEFRPSEIALAVAISVAGETQIIDLNNAFESCSSSSHSHLNKERVLKCYELVQEVVNSRTTTSPPLSPVGVLDAATLLSYDSSNIGGGGGDGGLLATSDSTLVDDAGESVNVSSPPKKRRLNLLMGEV